MQIEQFVMAYSVEHDRLRAILPDGYTSLRPVLRINAEVQNDNIGYVKFNTAVEKMETEAGLISTIGTMFLLREQVKLLHSRQIFLRFLLQV